MTEDVVIIGGGFAGQNVARLLKSHGISCQIFTSEVSASSLWAGTVDVINQKKPRNIHNSFNEVLIEQEIQEFLQKLPQHPYTLVEPKEMRNALDDFFDSFPQFEISKYKELYYNSPAMTAFGTLKPCIARWNSIFGEFERLNPDSKCVIVNFVEFNNSAADLIKKGLESRYPGEYRILKINLRQVLNAWGDAGKKWAKSKISLKEVAEIFENFRSNLSPVITEIKNALNYQYPTISNEKIDYFLFPPVVGLTNYRSILDNLNKQLNTECFETIGLSPSIMGNRLLGCFEQSCIKLGIQINRGQNFTSLKKMGDLWEVTFIDRKQTTSKVLAQKVIFATGSLFMSGPLVTDLDMQKFFGLHQITIPNPLGPAFQLIFNDDSISSLYCCGSASYRFKGGISDNDEIKYCTGLGLAIITSWKVAQDIIKK